MNNNDDKKFSDAAWADVDAANVTNKQRDAIERGAAQLGIDPVDYATAMSYESGGTFDPWQAGPVTKWGQHRGTIQYGEPQRKKYGVYKGQSFEDQVTNSNVRYLKDAGVRPGMTFAQIYAAIDGGNVNAKGNTQDANTGRTISDNIRNAERDHRQKVIQRFGWGSGEDFARKVWADIDPQQTNVSQTPQGGQSFADDVWADVDEGQPPAPNGVPLNIPRVGQPPSPTTGVSTQFAGASPVEFQPLTATTPFEELERAQMELRSNDLMSRAGTLNTSFPSRPESANETPPIQQSPDAQYSQYLTSTGLTDTPDARKEFTEQILPALQKSEADTQAANQNANAEYQRQVDEYNRQQTPQTQEGQTQASQPTTGKPIYATVQWTNDRSRDARAEALDSAASSLASKVGVDYDVMRSYLEKGGFAEGDLTTESARSKREKREQLQIGLDAAAVNTVKAMQADLDKRKAQSQETFARLSQNINPELSPADRDLELMKLQGEADVAAGLRDAEEFKKYYEKEVAGLTAWKEANGYANLYRNQRSDRIIAGAFATQGLQAPSTRRDQYEGDRQAAISQYGSLGKWLDAQKEFAKKYEKAPNLYLLDAGTTATAAAAKAPLKGLSAAMKSVSIAAEAIDRSLGLNDIPATERGFYNLGKDLDDILKNYAKSPKDFAGGKAEMFGDTLGQVGTQIVLGTLTGGVLAPTLFGAAMGASSQYEEASQNPNATPNQKLGAAAIGAALAVPDAIIMHGWFKAASAVERSAFLTRFADTVKRGLMGKGVSQMEAERASGAMVSGWLEQMASKPGVRGFIGKNFAKAAEYAPDGRIAFKNGAFEAGQEVSENKGNDLYAYATYDHTPERLQKILSVTNDDKMSALGGFFGGLFGGSIEAINERAAHLSAEEAASALPYLNELKPAMPPEKYAAAEKALNEQVKRGVRASSNRTVGENVRGNVRAEQQATPTEQNDENKQTEVPAQPAQVGEEALVSAEPAEGSTEVGTTAEPITEPTNRGISKTYDTPASGMVYEPPKGAKGATSTVEDAASTEKDAEIVSQTPAKPTTPEGQLVERVRQERRRADEATREAFTSPFGLPNGKAFEIAHNDRAKEDPTKSVVLFDLNGLKFINDNLSHTAGDERLQEVADIFAATAREQGIPERDVFHISGDEFTAIVPNEKAEAFRDAVERNVGVKEYAANGKRAVSSITGTIGQDKDEADATLTAAKTAAKIAQSKERGIVATDREGVALEKPFKPSALPVSTNTVRLLRGKQNAGRLRKQGYDFEIRNKGTVYVSKAPEGKTLGDFENDAYQANEDRLTQRQQNAGKSKSRYKKKALDFTQFAKSIGGIKPSGDTKNLSVKESGIVGLVSKNGLSADEIGERAYEAGYFSERPTEAEVINALHQDVSGDKIYSRQDIDDVIEEQDYEAASDRYHARQQLTEDNARRLATLSDVEVSALENIGSFLSADDVMLTLFQIENGVERSNARAILNKVGKEYDLDQQTIARIYDAAQERYRESEARRDNEADAGTQPEGDSSRARPSGNDESLYDEEAQRELEEERLAIQQESEADDDVDFDPSEFDAPERLARVAQETPAKPKPATAFDQTDLFGNPTTPQTEQIDMFGDISTERKGDIERIIDRIASRAGNERLVEYAREAFQVYEAAKRTGTSLSDYLKQQDFDGQTVEEGMPGRAVEFAKAMAAGTFEQAITEDQTFQQVASDINYEQAKNVAKRIENGEPTPRRLTQEAEQGRVAGGRRNVETSAILAAEEGASEKASAGSVDSNANTSRQIKSTAERPDTLFQKAPIPNDLGFYSQVEKVIADKMPNKASAEQVKGILDPKNGVKKEELEWLDIDSFLDGKKSVTKDELLDYIRANNVQVKEVRETSENGGGHTARAMEIARDAIRESYLEEYYDIRERDIENDDGDVIGTEYVATANGEDLGVFQDRYDAEAAVERSLDEVVENAFADEWDRNSETYIEQAKEEAASKGIRNEEWLTPGGENATTLILTMPPVSRPAFQVSGAKGDARISESFSLRSEAENRRRELDAEGYTTSVFDHPSIEKRTQIEPFAESDTTHYGDVGKGTNIGWVRGSWFDGGTTFNIGEIQSNRHQQGHRAGYKGDLDVTYADAAQKAKRLVRDASRNSKGDLEVTYDGIRVFHPTEQGLESALTNVIVDTQRDAEGKSGSLVPNAPFKSSWPLLHFKNALRYAIENGADRITWDTGDTQTRRYKNATDKMEGGMGGFYDNILPKQVAKYVKKWGGKVESSVLDNGEGTPVYSLKITPAMRESVVQGQPLFKKAGLGDKEYLTEVLPFAHTEDLLSEATGGKFVDGNIELNEADGELLRRIQSTFTGSHVTAFYGATHTAQGLKNLAKQALKDVAAYSNLGYTDAQIKPLRNLAKNLETLAGSGEAGITYVYDDSLPEETHHKLVLDAGGISQNAINKLKASPLWNASAQFALEYKGINDRSKAIELAAKLETDQPYFDKGDDFENLKKEFLNIIADDIIDRNTVNGVFTLDPIKFERITNYAKDQTGNETGRTEKQGSPGSQRPAQTQSEGEGFSPQGKEKRSKTPESLREKAGIPIGDRIYTSTTNSERQAFADVQMDKGIDEAVQWFDEQHADKNLNNGATAVVGINLINQLGKSGRISEMNAAADKLVPMVTEAAQSVQAMSMISLFDPERAGAYAAKVAKQKTGKDLTQEQFDKAVSIAKELSETAQASGLTDAALNKANDYIKELENEKSELEALHKQLQRKTSKIEIDLADALKTIKKLTREPRTYKTSRVKELLPRRDEILASIAQKYGSPLQMVAWHGSPHKFDKFDITKIGTGEGNQAYGWGLYFADREAVADHYKYTLSRNQPKVSFDGINATYPHGSVQEYAKRLGVKVADAIQLGEVVRFIETYENLHNNTLKNIDEVSAAMREDADSMSSRLNEAAPNSAQRNNLYDLLTLKKRRNQWFTANQDKIQIRPKGIKYKVDLKPAEDEYLLWDKSLSEQSEKVKKVLLALQKEEGESYRDGRDVYKKLSRKLAPDSGTSGVLRKGDKAASEYLKSLGIRGIKFLDGSSRKKGEGDYNYVIFDDADVEIEDFFQQAASVEVDPDLVDWAAIHLSENISKEVPSSFFDKLRTLTNGQVSDAEMQVIHAKAVEMLRQENPKTFEQKVASRIRNAHIAAARKVWGKEVRTLVNKPKKDAYAERIMTEGKARDYSPEAIWFAIVREQIPNVEDAIKHFKKTMSGNMRQVMIDADTLLQDVKKGIEIDRANNRYQKDLTETDVKQLKDLQKVQTGEAAAARRSANRFYSSLAQTHTETVLRALVDWRRAALLSGVRTHARNIISNVVFTPAEELSRLPAVVFDYAAGKFTKRRTVQFASPEAMWKSFRDIFQQSDTLKNIDRKSGKSHAFDILRYGASITELEMQQHLRSVIGEKFPKLAWMDNAINTSFDVLSAEDALFKTYAFRRSLEEQASVLAKNKEDYKNLISKPSNEMIAIADEYALYATYQDSNALSTWLAKQKNKSKWIKAGVETIVPYDRTPTNLVLRMLDYSPLGVGRAVSAVRKIGKEPSAAFRNTMGGLLDFNGMSRTEQAEYLAKALQEHWDVSQQRAFAKGMGRATFGTTLFALGVALAAKGILTGVIQPDDDDKKQTNEFFARMKDGIENRSIKLGGYRFVLPDDPGMRTMTAGATFYEQMNRSKGDTTLSLWNGAKAVAENALTDQPLVRGTGDLSENIRKGKVGQFAGNIAGGYVPTILSDIGEVIDDKPRSSSGYKADEKRDTVQNELLYQGRGLKNAFFRRIPIARQYLADESTFGVSAEERGGVSRRLVRAIDPFNTRSANSGRLLTPKELVKEEKRLSTDDVVTFLQETQKNVDKLDKKTQDQHIEEWKTILKTKAINARKAGTLTLDEVRRIKEVMPDFSITPRVVTKKKK